MGLSKWTQCKGQSLSYVCVHLLVLIKCMYTSYQRTFPASPAPNMNNGLIEENSETEDIAILRKECRQLKE